MIKVRCIMGRIMYSRKMIWPNLSLKTENCLLYAPYWPILCLELHKSKTSSNNLMASLSLICTMHCFALNKVTNFASLANLWVHLFSNSWIRRQYLGNTWPWPQPLVMSPCIGSTYSLITNISHQSGPPDDTSSEPTNHILFTFSQYFT